MINKSIGICIGASTVSAVYLKKEREQVTVESTFNIPHNGNPKGIVEDIFNNEISLNIVVTGKKFRGLLNLTSISEAEAVEIAFEHLNLSADIIISAGGENFIVYFLDKENKITKVSSGNKCASGTGEFFLQQIKRMNMDSEEAVSFGLTGEPYNISGRCSVFCKSDCTHALNKGVPKENVVAGLSRMMAQKIIELTSKLPHKKALLIGGVSKNKAMIRFLKEHFDCINIPGEAQYFEALGAAVYALNNDVITLDKSNLFREKHSAFTFHKPLKDFTSLVQFKEMNRGTAQPDDVCILGLDVGSTTTKAVLIKKYDNQILAAEYLRTNGDPVQASIDCYNSLKNQLDVPIKIIGLGVTGSGRHIAGLHALTKGIINEIIAHAAATVFFDKEVDTIFEIGGQDAKYTHITSGVASDYTMNEACSAGTGSFLEEAAKESLDIDFTEIGTIAMNAANPPNFNDQCAAFISSDIKNSLHEGLSKEDIVAGLVYSICMNYNNRVKGNRPVGKKVFMQGGVCYNKAVPVAMAALTGKEIIVSPEPGLMGAFGVALEIKHRIELGLIEPQIFSLNELINRQVHYDKTFVCAGGSEKCDRKCGISIISIDRKKYPFGGACNKYYNLQTEKNNDKEEDLVSLRQYLVFEKYVYRAELPADAPTIGISKSFLSNTLFPLFYNFFTQLGIEVIVGNEPKTIGIDKKEAAFCYPAELAHGFFQDLIDKKPDYIFLPHIKEIYNPDENPQKKTCVLLQSEKFYLTTAFKESLEDIEMLTPVFDFSNGYESEKENFTRLAVSLGKEKAEASAAFDFACTSLNEMFKEFRQIGKEFLDRLEKNPNKFAIVLFGRGYNAFAREANLGIPKKFSSRNIAIIPHDFLSGENLKSYNHMYWALGQQILKTARFVRNHPQLFGTFITNFSCGPDSFIITYFRNIMGKKPSLTLELDSHSADAGINTRIEAAIDIIKSFRELYPAGLSETESKEKKSYQSLKVVDSHTIIDSDGKRLDIFNPSVKMLIPSMGRIGTELFSAAFRYAGVHSIPLPVYDTNTLRTGRGNTSCKECLPLILNAGSICEYYENRENQNEKTLFFMAKGDGPCRLGQYHVFLEDLISKKEMKNIGVYTLTDEDSYGGLGTEFVIRGWLAIIISDVLKDIYNAILTLASDRQKALEIFENEKEKIEKKIEQGSVKDVYKQLEKTANVLNQVERKESIHNAKKIAIVGEIFVRHDEFSKMDLVQKLTDKGFVIKLAPIGEYIYYSNFLNSLEKISLKQKAKNILRDYKQKDIERKVKKALMKSGFVEYDLIKIKQIVNRSSHFIKPELEGEAILTVGSAFREIIEHVCGVISVGPFGCMPSRVAESILNIEMNIAGKEQSENKTAAGTNSKDDLIDDLPFLAIETDGNIFPQIIQSKIEIFMLQAERLHYKMQKSGNSPEKYKKVINRFLMEYEEKQKEEERAIEPGYNNVISETE